ncbi:MAG: cyclic nucleotide-binding domain-containing protein [Gammaproteobacteria bacterium]|nr:cyclic nucleotide-binding domain-containing protein [Gammaproteobacteria bacterium]MBU1440618.1 cyclic nucleotide-binding domain-containing protein [Gammaproteobacteria bacterium]MBU2287224.1 cyclic nucleotide-binding domain-containing protein [Gammaproteobacteria bacterium]MBU2408854.1 cyclic nucleotide-binding domain-containing protein [Gammaproteobacteria bacterium]
MDDFHTHSGPDLREHAIHVLMRMPAPAGMSRDEAQCVVDAMRPVHLEPDTLLFEEGDAVGNDYMALVLEGHLRAMSSDGTPDGEVVMSVLGPGSIVGEMGVLDGGPRSASCTTLTESKLGILSRDALFKLLDEHPGAAARLVLGLSQGLAERLRESNRRMRTLSQVTRALQAELNAVHAVNHRLLDAQDR